MEHILEIKYRAIADKMAKGDGKPGAMGLELARGEAYQDMVKAGLRNQIKKKYRVGRICAGKGR